MIKKITTITIIIMSIFLVLFYIISSTYSLIIDVAPKEKSSYKITISDLVKNKDGTYNSLYYSALKELTITPKEANIIIESIPLNNALNSIIENDAYNDIYNIIVESINEDDNISLALKSKIIIKINTHIGDITNYLYQIKIKI